MGPRLTAGILALSIIVVLALAGCEVTTKPKTPDYVDYGWQLMGEQNYRGAIEQFNIGATESPNYTDSWNGLGWAYGRLGHADTSITNFSIGVALGDQTIVGTEVLAGRSLADLALGQFNEAITDGKGALKREPSWVFRRDPTIDYRHITLTVATAFCSLGEFDSSLVWVRMLDPHFYADATTLSGKALIVAKLEALKEGF